VLEALCAFVRESTTPQQGSPDKNAAGKPNDTPATDVQARSR